jgi:hypothetical protein
MVRFGALISEGRKRSGGREAAGEERLFTQVHAPSMAERSRPGQGRSWVYRPLLDTLHFFDNSSDTPRLIFKDEADHITISDAALYEQLRRQFAP